MVISGKTLESVADKAGVNPALLWEWGKRYRLSGVSGLENHRLKHKIDTSHMKKNDVAIDKDAVVLSEDELRALGPKVRALYEQNQKLKAEFSSMKTDLDFAKLENEVLKKQIALREKSICELTQGEKAAVVKEFREKGYDLKNLLKIMKLSRSTYYFEINKEDAVALQNQELEAQIQVIFKQNHRRYGVRRVLGALLDKKWVVNHKRVQRIMHKAGLFGIRPKKKYHSYKGDVGRVADNVINRDFSTTRPLEKWTTDVTQFNFSWGKCYLSPILDMHTNEIISYDLSLHPTLKQEVNMLNRAFKKFNSLSGLILHSDQGWQYQHKVYRRMLEEHGIKQSMSRKGNCYDNCIMESFFGRMKNEMFYGFEESFKSFKSFSKAVAKYINYFNNERIQQKTKWMPPVKYREASMC